MKSKYRGRRGTATCHTAFGLDEKCAFATWLTCYTLCVVDELFSQQGYLFEHIIRMRNLGERTTGMLILGDRWQQATFGNVRPWPTKAWTFTFKCQLFDSHRCQCPELRSILNVLRTGKPALQLLRILRAKRAWPPGAPTIDGIQRLLHAHSDTVIMTCTRTGACDVNFLGLQALFPRHPPSAVLPGDIETNPANHTEHGDLKDYRLLCIHMECEA